TLKGPSNPLAWPAVGSAALDIPSFGVLEGYHDQSVPIASLTKMMTVYVALMNQEATTLGLSGTHYDDVTGFSPLSVSTALDQARLATLLMKSVLVRSIVIQPSVTLPVAGTVASFTPYVGIDNVIGVKSGRTAEAGGCDVMAMTFPEGSSTKV